jgi:hypothetical protein
VSSDVQGGTADTDVHLNRLSAADRAFIEETENEATLDPGTKSMRQVRAMTPDERLVYQHQRAQWQASMPFLYTPVADRALTALTVSALAATTSPSTSGVFR